MLAFDERSHTYTWQGVRLPSVTEILRRGGAIDAGWYTEAARLRGQYVHRAIEYAGEDDLDEASLAPEIQPYYDAYREWVELSGFDVWATEVRVVHPRLGYAGTLDAIGRLRGYTTVVEYKTGSLPRWAGMQVAAYVVAANYSQSGGAIAAGVVVRLRPNARFKLRRYSIPDEWRRFLACYRGLQGGKGWTRNQSRTI